MCKFSIVVLLLIYIYSLWFFIEKSVKFKPVKKEKITMFTGKSFCFKQKISANNNYADKSKGIIKLNIKPRNYEGNHLNTITFEVISSE